MLRFGKKKEEVEETFEKMYTALLRQVKNPKEIEKLFPILDDWRLLRVQLRTFSARTPAQRAGIYSLIARLMDRLEKLDRDITIQSIPAIEAVQYASRALQNVYKATYAKASR